HIRRIQVQTLTEARQPSVGRRWFGAVCVLGSVALEILLAYVFNRYPGSSLSTGTGPGASVPQWFGANGAATAYMTLGLGISCLYIYVGLQGTGRQGVWRQGVTLGFVLGLGWLVLSVLGLVARTDATGLLLAAAVLIMPTIAGALGARSDGDIIKGALEGFWCGLAAALCIALAVVAVDVAFASSLMESRWAQDSQCHAHLGDALAACEIGGDLGFAATVLVALPAAMAILGAFGGAFGAGYARDRFVAVPRDDNQYRAPIVFLLIMGALFLTELIFNLW